MNLLKPNSCYKYWYILDKFDVIRCKCIIHCKYPPPKELVPIKNKERIPFKYTNNDAVRKEDK